MREFRYPDKYCMGKAELKRVLAILNGTDWTIYETHFEFTPLEMKMNILFGYDMGSPSHQIYEQN